MCIEQVVVSSTLSLIAESLSSSSRNYKMNKLFGSSFLFVTALRKLFAAGSRHNPNDKSELGRLRSRSCMIDFLVSEADGETQQLRIRWY